MIEIKLSEWAIKERISEEAVRLLKKTIDEKWKPIFNETGVDDGTMNCSLCEEFRGRGLPCHGCPISQETGKQWCDGTPHKDWSSHHDKNHPKRRIEMFPRKVECPECKEAVQKVINFAEALYKKCIKED